MLLQTGSGPEKVSVIVPVYNVEEYVGQCIESIAGQTYENLEVIIINDGSTDASLSVCRSFEAEDSRIFVIDQENKGVSAARNAGISACSGTWICFVDGDDRLEADAIEKMLSCVSGNTDILITDYFVDAGAKIWQESFFNLPDHDFSREEHIELIKNCYLRTSFAASDSTTLVGVPWAKLFRAESIKGRVCFDEKLKKMQDALFMSEAVQSSEHIIFRKIPTYHYRQNAASVTHRGDASYQMIADAVLAAFESFIKKYGFERELTAVLHARRFIFACETVKFVYILDETGMSFSAKKRGIKGLMRGFGKGRKDMLPYLEKAYKAVYVMDRLHMYGVMYLAMAAFYKMRMRKMNIRNA